MISYISLGIAILSLLLGIYNWYQSLLKLRADIKVYCTRDNCHAVETTISNLSSRPFTILDSYILDGKVKLNEAEIRNARDFYVYMHDGENVGTSKSKTSYPVQISPYGASYIERVLTSKPSRKSKLIIVTPSKKFRFKIPVE